MASYRKRAGSWQAQVRRKGQSPITKTFKHKADAEAWARKIEAEIDRTGLPLDPRHLDRMTVGDLLKRYRDEIAPHKRSANSEMYRLRILLRDPIADLKLSAFTSAMAAKFRDRRLKQVSSGSVRRDLTILRHMMNIARREWDIPAVVNPIQDIKLPPHGKARDRRLEQGEFERLMDECQNSRNPLLKPIIIFAIETGMRRGEILNVRWADIDLERRTLHIPRTKTDFPRTIPLTSRARDVLSAQERDGDALVFPVTGNALRLSWTRLRQRAGIVDLHFHDLRHEAISRFFEMGLSVPEVALISGHRDYRMLARYTHMRAEDVVLKLR